MEVLIVRVLTVANKSGEDLITPNKSEEDSKDSASTTSLHNRQSSQLEIQIACNLQFILLQLLNYLFVICVNQSIYIRVNRKKSNQVILLKGVSAEFYLLCFLLFNLSKGTQKDIPSVKVYYCNKVFQTSNIESEIKSKRKHLTQ